MSGRSLRSRQSTVAHAAAAAEPNEDAADEPASQAGPRAEAEAGDAAGGAFGGKSLEELAVRFSQATKELQANTRIQALCIILHFFYFSCVSVGQMSHHACDGKQTATPC